MSYDFSPLHKAIASLEDILRQPIDDYLRDGVIQRFEYTFELCWKYLQRILKHQGVSCGSPKQVLRSAAKAGFIDDLDLWFGFLEKRNLSVHTYNENVAAEVFESAKKFPKYAKEVYEVLNRENVDDA